MNLSNIKITPLIYTLQMVKISDEEYFSSKYENYISNSRLKLINPEEGGTPKKYLDGFSKEYNESFYIGTIYHECFLQPETYEICNEVDRPSGKTGFLADEIYNKGIYNPSDSDIVDAAKTVNFYGGNISKNTIDSLKNKIIPYLNDRYNFESNYSGNKIVRYLDNYKRRQFLAAMSNLFRHGQIQSLIRPKYPENLIVTKNEEAILLDLLVEIEGKEFVLKIKSKLDNFSINLRDNIININDLKTTSNSINEFNDAIYGYHYYREMGIYAFLLTKAAEKYYGISNAEVNANFVVVSTNNKCNSEVALIELDKKSFCLGVKEYQYLIRLVAYYTYYGF